MVCFNFINNNYNNLNYYKSDFKNLIIIIKFNIMNIVIIAIITNIIITIIIITIVNIIILMILIIFENLKAILLKYFKSVKVIVAKKN